MRDLCCLLSAHQSVFITKSCRLVNKRSSSRQKAGPYLFAVIFRPAFVHLSPPPSLQLTARQLILVPAGLAAACESWRNTCCHLRTMRHHVGSHMWDKLLRALFYVTLDLTSLGSRVNDWIQSESPWIRNDQIIFMEPHYAKRCLLILIFCTATILTAQKGCATRYRSGKQPFVMSWRPQTIK